MCYKIGNMMLVVIQRRQVFSSMPWMPVWVMYLAGCLGMAGLSIRVIQSRVVEYIEKNKGMLPESEE